MKDEIPHDVMIFCDNSNITLLSLSGVNAPISATLLSLCEAYVVIVYLRQNGAITVERRIANTTDA